MHLQAVVILLGQGAFADVDFWDISLLYGVRGLTVQAFVWKLRA
jgi:hypothetical protein